MVRGTLKVAGLQQPVNVLRDRWGVPHIYAHNQHDLFFAQGFVAAQDRIERGPQGASVQPALQMQPGPQVIGRTGGVIELSVRGGLGRPPDGVRLGLEEGAASAALRPAGPLDVRI